MNNWHYDIRSFNRHQFTNILQYHVFQSAPVYKYITISCLSIGTSVQIYYDIMSCLSIGASDGNCFFNKNRTKIGFPNLKCYKTATCTQILRSECWCHELYLLFHKRCTLWLQYIYRYIFFSFLLMPYFNQIKSNIKCSNKFLFNIAFRLHI